MDLPEEGNETDQGQRQKNDHSNAAVGQAVKIDVMIVPQGHGNTQDEVLEQPRITQPSQPTVARVKVEVSPKVIQQYAHR